jgi:ABC-type bacteriocin/lantibiotic exporter with double-glycine peptidase domain
LDECTPRIAGAGDKGCGVFAVWTIAKIYGSDIERANLYSRRPPDRERGSTFQDLLFLFESLDLPVRACRINFPERLTLHLPCVAHLRSNHFVVLLECSVDHAVIYDEAYQRRSVTSDWFFSRFSMNIIEIDLTPSPVVSCRLNVRARPSAEVTPSSIPEVRILDYAI